MSCLGLGKCRGWCGRAAAAGEGSAPLLRQGKERVLLRPGGHFETQPRSCQIIFSCFSCDVMGSDRVRWEHRAARGGTNRGCRVPGLCQGSRGGGLGVLTALAALTAGTSSLLRRDVGDLWRADHR